MAKSSWQLAICQLHSANPEKYNLSFFEDARKSKQSKIACFLALPTFTLNYYQIMKRIQRNVKSDSFNYLIIYYSQYFCINHSLIRKEPYYLNCTFLIPKSFYVADALVLKSLQLYIVINHWDFNISTSWPKPPAKASQVLLPARPLL